MTARDRLRAWDVFFWSSNLTHKSCGIFVALWGFAHCIGTRLVFHIFLSQRKEDKWSNAKKKHQVLKMRLLTHYRPASQKWTMTLESTTVNWFRQRYR